jgi:hypothetical protein
MAFLAFLAVLAYITSAYGLVTETWAGARPGQSSFCYFYVRFGRV